MKNTACGKATEPTMTFMFLFEGKESISYNFLSNMEEGDYDAEGDWQQMSGQALLTCIHSWQPALAGS